MNPTNVNPEGQQPSLESLFEGQISEPRLETCGMIIAGFQIQDKLGKVGMSFLTLKNADVLFAEKELV